MIAGTGGPAVAPADCAGLTLGVRPEHIALGFDRGVPATVAAIEYLGADSLVTCRLGATTLAVRVPGSVGLARGDADAPVVGARRAASVRARRRASRRARSTRNRDDVRVDPHFRFNQRRKAMLQKTIRAAAAFVAALRWSSLAPAVARAGAGRSLVLLPRRRRRPDHQDHRRLRRGLREGESRRQDQADLLRHLPGHDHQGADGGEGRRAAGDVDPAVDRHVHADRRGRDRSVRRSHQDAGRPGVAQELLPGVHGEQPDRRQDLGHSVPALDDRPLLQQGSVQGSGARPEQAAGELEGDGRVRAEAHQARRVGQGDAVGRADSVVGLPVLAVPGRSPSRPAPT